MSSDSSKLPKALPDPPVPPDLDVSTFQRMQLDILALLSSETYAMATGDQFKAALTLWIQAFHQVPAGSLPNNMKIIASFAGYGNSLEKFQEEIAPVAMRGFKMHNDGRLYHRKVCEIAVKANAWRMKQQGGPNGRQGYSSQAETPGTAKLRSRLNALGRAAGRS